MSRVFIGVDPGANGAVAVIDEGRNVLLAEAFPIVKVAKSPRTVKRRDKITGKMVSKTIRGFTTEFDFVAVAALFNRVAALGDPIVVLEHISSMGRDAKASAFTFGGSFWALRMALADRGIGYQLVRPKKWQDIMLAGVHHRGDKALKKAYLAVARNMFGSKVDLSLEKHHDIAAALLMAEYVRRDFVKT